MLIICMNVHHSNFSPKYPIFRHCITEPVLDETRDILYQRNRANVMILHIDLQQ